MLRYNRRRDTRKGGKLNARYNGPFVIAEVMGKGVYKLATVGGSPVKTLANSRDLKAVPTDGYASPSKSTASADAKNAATKSPDSATETTDPTSHTVAAEDDPTESPPTKRTRRTKWFADADPVWIQRLHLRISDRELVCKGWLNDRVIDAINRIIANNLGSAAQTTLLSQSNSGFAACQQETIMILHANQHWVTVAADTTEVRYFDSLRPHQALTSYVTKQIKQLFPQHVRSDGNIDLLIYPSTPQTNGADCGVFASAYAAELLSGNTQGVQAPFDVKAMRPHLIQCLEMESLTPFPKLAGRRQGRRAKVIKVTVNETGVHNVAPN